MNIDETIVEVQGMIDCGGITKREPVAPAPPRPLVNRCACGCGQPISNNRIMTRDCWIAYLARQEEQKAS